MRHTLSQAAAAGWLTPAVGLAAALPIVAATVEGLREGATPTGDRAIILTRAYDVLSSHTPLVGQFSASSLLYDHILHSLGPLPYWLLALPVRIDPAVAPAVTLAAVNVLAILLAVACARRLAGVAGMVGAAIALALMSGSFSPETLHDVWNPSVALLPFTALLFMGWALACGQRRLLPLAVLAGSFAAQAELVFLVPSAAALALGIAGLLSRGDGRREAWRCWLAALAVGLVCWSAPIAEELGGHPGNLTLVAQAAFSHGHTIGLRAGWRAVVHALGVPPWWLTRPHDPFGRLADLRRAPAHGAAISCVAILAALLAMLVVGALRRRRELAWAAAIALALCVSLAATTASTPSRPSLEKSLGYMLWLGSPVGMWAWLALALALGTAVARWRRRAAARWAPGIAPARSMPHAAAVTAPPGRAPRAAAAGRALLTRSQALLGPAALAAVLGVGAAVASGQRSDQDRPEYGPVKLVQAAVRRALGTPAGTVLVTGSHRFTAFDFRAAVIYDLRRRGWRVYAPAASERLGSWYEPPSAHAYRTIWVFDQIKPPRRGRVIERLRYGSAPAETITVTLSGRRPPRR